jgi:hypothetical protein
MAPHRSENFIQFLARNAKKPVQNESKIQSSSGDELKSTENYGEIQQQITLQYPRESLLGLPQEIRDKIYVFCIPSTDVKYSLLTPYLPELGGSLRLTCRQLYFETQKLCWTRGTLHIYSHTRNKILSISHLGPQTSLIKRVGFQSSLPDLSLACSKITKSDLTNGLQPRDLIVELCTCALKDLDVHKYLRLMASVRDAITILLEAWPSLTVLAFFHCGDIDPADNTDFPTSSSTPASLWTLPSTFRSSFEPDARYFGPWYTDSQTKNGEIEYLMERYDGRGKVERTVQLDFFNVMDLHSGQCVLQIRK